MEETKAADEVTLRDLKEVIDGQTHRIDALTSLVRAQQVTMDRLLRAVDTLLQELTLTPTNPNWP